MNIKEKEREKERINHYLSIIEPKIGDSGIVLEGFVELALAEIQATFGYPDYLTKALNDMKREGLFNYDELVKILNAKTIRVAKTKYTYYLPLNFEYNDAKGQTFLVGKTKFTIYPIGLVSHRKHVLDIDMISRGIPNSRIPNDINRPFLRFSDFGSDAEDGMRQGMIDLQHFRSAFNFIFSRRQSTYHPNNSTTQNSFLLPHWMVYKGKLWESGFFVQSEMREALKRQFRREAISEAARLANALISKKGTFKNFLSDVLALYNEARDLEYEKEAFLAYWRLLERMALASNFRGNTKEIVDRISILFEIRNFKYPPHGLLDYMAKTRNTAVHNGDYSAIYNLGDINRFIVIIIEMLLDLSNNIKTEIELDYIYRNFHLKPLKTESLRKSVKTIEVINAKRQVFKVI